MIRAAVRRNQKTVTGWPMRIEVGDRVLVTGAAGFIGAAVTRSLLGRGARVVAILEPAAADANLDGLEVERIVADVNDVTAIRRAAEGTRFVFHLAALYRFWPRSRDRYYEVNVDGTRNVLTAARAAGCERVVFTSTVATLGHPPTEVADETTYPRISSLVGDYEQSKYVAEHEALREAATGLPLVLVQPSAPFGPGDSRPTPTGRLVVDFLNGRMVGYTDTVMNVVDVGDVAEGHLLAAERGAIGTSYILGGENLELRQVLGHLAARTGLGPPRVRVPSRIVVPAAYVAETVQGRLRRRDPRVTVAEARIAGSKRSVSDARARREIGYETRPAAEALERSARWFVGHGYVSSERTALIRWASS